VAAIVLVHGIGQQVKGPDSLAAVWVPALRDGMTAAGVPPVAADDVCMAFYGDLYRTAGKAAGTGWPPLSAADVDSDWERLLLELWWREAAGTDPAVPAPEAGTKARTPRMVQRALDALSQSAFFAGLAERAMIGTLKQVAQYFADDALRSAVGARVAAAVSGDTQVVVAHSLGTVAAYEAVCTHPEWGVTTLVTLGSPLGIRNLVFDRLRPAPGSDGTGRWPGGVRTWSNIADSGDVVALVKSLRPLFGDWVTDVLVRNGAKAHDVLPYLTARETGEAIGRGLAG
jgi:hypothetical protein